MDAETANAEASVTSLMARLGDAETRVNAAAKSDPPTGLTEPDPGAEERWNVGQVWAHMAEFVPYWKLQLEKVFDRASAQPVPFGRVRTDPTRNAAIAAGVSAKPADVVGQVTDSLAGVRALAADKGPTDWSREGLHPTLGVMDARRMLERFLVTHLEEHAAQLERLAAATT